MIQRSSFQKLRAYATNQAFTPDQIRNANKNKDQIQSQLSLTDAEVEEYRHFWPGMKEILLRDALEREQKERLILLRNQLNSAYADAQLDSERVEELATELLPYLYGEV